MAERATDQKVEAFSAPVGLLKNARDEARRRKMSKSGFFRYCLARELGYSEEECNALAMFMPIARFQLETNSALPCVGSNEVSAEERRVLREAVGFQPKGKAALPIDKTSGRASRAGEESSGRQEPRERAPKKRAS